MALSRRGRHLLGRHVPHGLQDGHRHLHHHPAALHPHLHQEPGGQLGLVGAVSNLLVGLEVGSDARKGGRPRQELSTQDPGPQRPPVAPTAARRLRQPVDQEVVAACLLSR